MIYDATGLLDVSHSRRTHHNVHYRQPAMGVLRQDEDGDYRWLYDHENLARGAPGRHWRQSTLAALGRIKDDETLIAAARRICELKPSAVEAIAMLRQLRLQRSPPPCVLGLMAAIETAVDHYVVTHPDTTHDQIQLALEGVRTNFSNWNIDHINKQSHAVG